MDQFRIGLEHRFDEQWLQMFQRQASSRRRQVALPNAQHDQALLDTDLHRVIREPDPIVTHRLGSRELEQPHSQQPHSTAGPMRRGGRKSPRLDEGLEHRRRGSQGGSLQHAPHKRENFTHAIQHSASPLIQELARLRSRWWLSHSAQPPVAVRFVLRTTASSVRAAALR